MSNLHIEDNILLFNIIIISESKYLSLRKRKSPDLKTIVSIDYPN